MDVRLCKKSLVLALLCLTAALCCQAAQAQDSLPAPAALQAVLTDDGRAVMLSWEPLDPELAIKGYNIYRGPDAERMGRVAIELTEPKFIDVTVGPNLAYYYKVEAVGQGGPGPGAVVGPIMIAAQVVEPAPPRGLAAFDSAFDSGHSIHVVWYASPDDQAGSFAVNSYDVYRSDDPAFGTRVWIARVVSGDAGKLAQYNEKHYEAADKAGEAALPDSLRYVVVNESLKNVSIDDPKYVENGKPYYYRVVSKVQGVSEPSATSEAVIVAPPQPATWVKAAAGTNGGIDLSWGKSPDDGLFRQVVESYNIYRSTSAQDLDNSANLIADVDAAGSKDPRPRAQSWTDKTAEAGASYFYLVKAATTGGVSKDNPSTKSAVSVEQAFVEPPAEPTPAAEGTTEQADEQAAAAEAGPDQAQTEGADETVAAAEAPPELIETPPPTANVAPVSELQAHDVAGDFGGRILISFLASPDESAEAPKDRADEVFVGYEVLRSEDPFGQFEPITLIPASGLKRYFLVDDKGVKDGVPYYYRVIAKKVGGSSESVLANNATAAVSYMDNLPPRPPSNITAEPIITDQARLRGRIRITWELSPDDSDTPTGRARVTGYDIYRATKENIESGTFQLVDHVDFGVSEWTDLYASNRTSFAYRVIAVSSVKSEPLQTLQAAEAHPQWFDLAKLPYFVVMLVISFAIIFFIEHAKKGRKMFIRKIAGLEAVDDAIGRATEMGKSIMFVPGIMDINDVQTLAALTILARISKTIAEHDTLLHVPTSKSLVMTTAREVVKEAFLEAGRPDAYNADNINYLTDDQFGYVAGVTGMMVRDKPATCFFLGSFYAESLILAETGNLIGAIQIAGTAQPAQLPFFIAACDYTLIGEELFAASAYLSGEPRQLGSLKGQDIGKAIAMCAIVLGSIIETISQLMLASNPESTSAIVRFSEWFRNLFALPN